MLFGIASYSGYFLLSHSIQQIANDAARSALGGLNAIERQSLAQQIIVSESPYYGSLNLARTKVIVSDTANLLTVSVSYDASGSGFWAAQGLLPMPSSTITRVAMIRLGGY
jgi:Flp pilus assembly protein TadG